jgi:hypothetical protein
MCFSSPSVPAPPPPPAPPPLPTAGRAVTQRAMRAEPKKRRGTQQLTVRRPSVGMGGAVGQTGVQLSQ